MSHFWQKLLTFSSFKEATNLRRFKTDRKWSIKQQIQSISREHSQKEHMLNISCAFFYQATFSCVLLLLLKAAEKLWEFLRILSDFENVLICVTFTTTDLTDLFVSQLSTHWSYPPHSWNVSDIKTCFPLSHTLIISTPGISKYDIATHYMTFSSSCRW